MNDVTRILSQIHDGDTLASERLLPLVYDELRRLAAQKLTREKPGQTLQATALVHEAYIRLVDIEKSAHWNSRGHFFGAAAEAMRRILIDHARAKGARKRGGGYQRLELDSAMFNFESCPDEVLDLDEAIEKLSERDQPKAELVKLRFFAGLSMPEAAEAMGIAPRTARDHWVYARAWLYRHMTRASEAE